MVVITPQLIETALRTRAGRLLAGLAVATVGLCLLVVAALLMALSVLSQTEESPPVQYDDSNDWYEPQYPMRVAVMQEDDDG